MVNFFVATQVLFSRPFRFSKPGRSNQLRYFFTLFLLVFVTELWAEVPVPPLSHRVTDLTATLTGEQSTALENKLAAFEAKKGSQIAVLILPTTQGEDIAGFGIRVAEAWKIGRKGIDDGVILIIAKEDRKLRLEVGRGLEGAIPDAIAKRVLAETIKPYFKNNDYAGGIEAGVNQVISLIEGEKLPEIQAESTSGWEVFAIIMLFVVSGVGFFWWVIRGISVAFSSNSADKKNRRKRRHNRKQNNNDTSFWSSSTSSSSTSDWSSSDSSSSSDWGGSGGDFGGGGASDSW